MNINKICEIKMPILKKGKYIYQVFKNRECVYIGKTNNIRGRIREHSKKSWFDDNMTLHIKLFNDPKKAKQAEIEMVGLVMPVYNKFYNPLYETYRDRDIPPYDGTSIHTFVCCSNKSAKYTREIINIDMGKTKSKKVETVERQLFCDGRDKAE